MREPFMLYGQIFGLHQDRARLFETGGGFKLRAESGLFAAGRDLRKGSCLGRRRRFPRNDAFGRRVEPGGRRVCCDGDIWATQGTSPTCGDVVDHALSMGIDPGHMSYADLAQAVPPDYASFIVGQAAEHALRTQYGVQTRSFDELEADPGQAQAEMRHLLRGAGGTSATAGQRFVSARAGDDVSVTSCETGAVDRGRIWAEWSFAEMRDELRLQAQTLQASGQGLHPKRREWLEALAV